MGYQKSTKYAKSIVLSHTLEGTYNEINRYTVTCTPVPLAGLFPSVSGHSYIYVCLCITYDILTFFFGAMKSLSLPS